jgi:hypothetical protein
MNQIYSAVIALAALAGVTVYEGIRFGFWNKDDPEELAHFVERLKTIPESFGDWTSEAAKYDSEQLAVAQVRGHVSRDYIHRKTGAKVNVFLACGQTHPMSIHSPEQCYAAAGFAQGETSRRYKHVNGKSAELWFARFTRTQGYEREELDILWSWAPDDGNWLAPTNPRPQFSNKDSLYKMYLITAPGAQIDNKPAADVFLDDFLPLLDERLFGVDKSQDESDAET